MQTHCRHACIRTCTIHSNPILIHTCKSKGWFVTMNFSQSSINAHMQFSNKLKITRHALNWIWTYAWNEYMVIGHQHKVFRPINCVTCVQTEDFIITSLMCKRRIPALHSYGQFRFAMVSHWWLRLEFFTIIVLFTYCLQISHTLQESDQRYGEIAHSWFWSGKEREKRVS